MTAFAGSTRGRFSVPSNVRVREEDFGLLFYDVGDQTLTFVKCGRLLGVTCEEGKVWVRVTRGGGLEALERLTARLLEKGLIALEDR